MGRKPRLPYEVQQKIPANLVHLITSFIPPIPKPSPPSPSLQRWLEKLQKSPKRTTMDLYGLEDFVLN